MRETKIGKNVFKVSKNNERELRGFYSKAYSKDHILNNKIHHDWQFLENPYNDFPEKSILIIKENEIRSHLGIQQIKIKLLDSEIRAAWHMSFFTLEEYRGKGLGEELILQEKNRFDMTLVLNGSEGTKIIYEKNDGIYFGDLNRYIAILNKKRIEQFLGIKIELDETSNDKMSKNFSREKLLDNTYEEFWDKVKDRYPITIKRERKYLMWRYIEHPLIDYHFMVLRNKEKIVGYAIIHFETNNDDIKAGRIVDLIVLEEFEDEILKSVLNYCRPYVDFVDYYSTGNFHENSLLQTQFFIENKKIKFPSVFRPVDNSRSSKINFFLRLNKKIEEEDVFNLDKWYIVKGDSDQDRIN